MNIDELQSGSVPVVAAHRGYKAAYPENTLLAFQKALELNVRMIEFDLRMTRDKVVVVLHDETLDRTTNGTGPVLERMWEEVRLLDAGGWFHPVFEGLKIPRLEQFCELLMTAPDVLLNVEIKPSPDAVDTADRAVAMLKEYGLLERCVFTSFDAAVLGYLFDRYQVRTQGFLAEDMKNFDGAENGTYSKMWAIAFPMRKLNRETVQRFREQGHLTWCYCPDTEEQAAFALECGATLMTCNNPLPAMKLVQRPAMAADA